ncbi:HD domain-containing phosphohydrolase [Legionella drozanskii]|uniref:Metal dependent phosphohydrolase n=1 Tax=Legionella drozanskii LLAP-1 TaxID=1212489 RepID=A0A0W0TC67_9GAMM|nr:HD domain-containing phosphohydrolase [Legionella drozanskii]KTC93158.1 metal dependent phosphohydrolase [Legionella drozanskii LLAP-1]
MKKITPELTYDNIFEQTPSAIFVCDSKGQFILTNNIFCKMFGYQQNEIYKLNIKDIYAIENLDPYMHQTVKFGEGKITVYHRALQGKNKNVFYGQVTLINIGNNLTQGFITTASVDKNILDKLIESEQRFKQITDHIRDVFFLFDLGSKKFIYVSPGYIKISERSVDSLYADTNSWMERIHPEDQEHIQQQFRQHFKTGTFEETFRVIKKNGKIIWLHARAYPVRDAQNKLYRSTGFVEDITAQIARVQDKLAYAEKLDKSFSEMLAAFSIAMEQRDPYTVGHQKNVAYLSVAIARELGLSEEEIRCLESAALTHDIGKIGIPSEILNKPSSLTPLEYEMIKTHAQAGYDILKPVHFPGPVADIVLEHHERLNGSGYPRGLKGKQIKLETRILSVADVVDAMTSLRPYRASLGLEAALAEISKGRDTLFDGHVIDVCIKLFKDKKVPLYNKESH